LAIGVGSRASLEHALVTWAYVLGPKFICVEMWLTPVILAAQEAEIRRIEVQSQPWQIVLKTLSQKKKTLCKKGLVEWLKV
jgi:hypothetical protein